MPILNLFEKIRPDIITVAMDPEASGPDTHYKVLQAVASALAIYLENNPEEGSCMGIQKCMVQISPCRSRYNCACFNELVCYYEKCLQYMFWFSENCFFPEL